MRIDDCVRRRQRGGRGTADSRRGGARDVLAGPQLGEDRDGDDDAEDRDELERSPTGAGVRKRRAGGCGSSQPTPSSGTKIAVLTISARPYEVVQIWETADSSVSARARPVAAITITAESATVEKRVRAARRSPSSAVARGTT